MTKAVFTTKVDPTYDDLPEFRYHFPRTYLRTVESTVGDWIIYYEPRRSTGELSSRGGRQAYFATARVVGVRTDPTLDGHYYAFVEDFLQFPRAVPFRDGDLYIEAALRRSDGATNKGAFGRAVRPISDDEYGLILSSASSDLLISSRADTPASLQGLADEQALIERPVVERVTNHTRPFRDASVLISCQVSHFDHMRHNGVEVINGAEDPNRLPAFALWLSQVQTQFATDLLYAAQFTGCLIVACFRWAMI